MSTVSRNQSTYFYRAARAAGGRAWGLRQARDRRQLATELRRERLVALQTWELPRWLSVGGGARLSLKDQAELNLQLWQLLSRGVPLVEALDVVGSAVGSQTRGIVRGMRDSVASGSSFADACLASQSFDRVTIAVYRAAERTGDLPGAAKQLALSARRQIAVTGKATTLLIYPAIVLSISVVMTLFMLTFVVPRVGRALASSGQELPWFTRAMFAAGTFLKDHIGVVALGAVVVVALAVLARKRLGVLAGHGLRRVPAARDLLLAQESTRFFTVMGAMTRSGIPLADALAVATPAISHPTLKKQLATLQTRLVEGGVLRHLIDQADALPLPTRRLLVAAERSGDLTPAFETLAQDMSDEVERRSARLLAVLEPALIVLMFLIIGSVLMAIMIPLLNLSSMVT